MAQPIFCTLQGGGRDSPKLAISPASSDRISKGSDTSSMYRFLPPLLLSTGSPSEMPCNSGDAPPPDEKSTVASDAAPMVEQEPSPGVASEAASGVVGISGALRASVRPSFVRPSWTQGMEESSSMVTLLFG